MWFGFKLRFCLQWFTSTQCAWKKFLYTFWSGECRWNKCIPYLCFSVRGLFIQSKRSLECVSWLLFPMIVYGLTSLFFMRKQSEICSSNNFSRLNNTMQYDKLNRKMFFIFYQIIDKVDKFVPMRCSIENFTSSSIHQDKTNNLNDIYYSFEVFFPISSYPIFTTTQVQEILISFTEK